MQVCGTLISCEKTAQTTFAETLVDKAMALRHVGGTYGGNKKPTPFICLILKMLQIQPEKEIIIEFIKNEDYKYVQRATALCSQLVFRYVRLLGAFYLRLVGKPVEIYQYLEPLYNDFRKVRKIGALGVYLHIAISRILFSHYNLSTLQPLTPQSLTLLSLTLQLLALQSLSHFSLWLSGKAAETHVSFSHSIHFSSSHSILLSLSSHSLLLLTGAFRQSRRNTRRRVY